MSRFLTLVVLALAMTLAVAHSTGSPDCVVDPTDMNLKMGGYNNYTWGFDTLASVLTVAPGGTIDISLNGTTPIKGYLVWAQNDKNQLTGTWTTSAPGLKQGPSSQCITHNSAALKDPTSVKSTLKVPSDASGVITVMGYAVVDRTDWQSLSYVTVNVTGSGSKSNHAATLHGGMLSQLLLSAAATVAVMLF
ncbi:hypothetical protein RI367_006307 [Sorochytrium milnesiophthora]